MKRGPASTDRLTLSSGRTWKNTGDVLFMMNSSLHCIICLWLYILHSSWYLGNNERQYCITTLQELARGQAWHSLGTVGVQSRLLWEEGYLESWGSGPGERGRQWWEETLCSGVSLSQLQRGCWSWQFGGQRSPHSLTWPHFRVIRPLGQISGFDNCPLARLWLAHEMALVCVFDMKLSGLLGWVVTC